MAHCENSTISTGKENFRANDWARAEGTCCIRNSQEEKEEEEERNSSRQEAHK